MPPSLLFARLIRRCQLRLPMPLSPFRRQAFAADAPLSRLRRLLAVTLMPHMPLLCRHAYESCRCRCRMIGYFATCCRHAFCRRHYHDYGHCRHRCQPIDFFAAILGTPSRQPSPLIRHCHHCRRHTSELFHYFAAISPRHSHD